MNQEKFLEIVRETHNKRLEILCDLKKKRNFASDDRLINFKELADVLDMYPAEVAITFATKQFMDILHIVREDHALADNLNYFRELINDVQNYLDLAYALKVEEKEEEELVF